MKIESIAAVDVGSNTVRLLVNNVEEYEEGRALKKNAYVRVPVRLGEGVFRRGRLEAKKIALLAEALRGFGHLMRVYGVRRYRACATSAFREAANGPETAARLARETGLKIDILTGDEEADLVFAAGSLASILVEGRNYLHVDVGGGSTEVAVYADGRRGEARSFPLGALRFLAGRVTAEDEAEFDRAVSEIYGRHRPLEIIASGGNINKTLKLLGGRDGQALPLAKLAGLHRDLAALSLEDRLRLYQLNSYRADVIVPALAIFLRAGRLCRARRLRIPKVGLVDGIIHRLHQGDPGRRLPARA